MLINVLMAIHLRIQRWPFLWQCVQFIIVGVTNYPKLSSRESRHFAYIHIYFNSGN